MRTTLPEKPGSVVFLQSETKNGKGLAFLKKKR